MSDINPAPEGFKNAVRDVLLSPGWQMLFASNFRPTVRKWRSILLWQEDIDDVERRGIQKAMALFGEGIVGVYEKAGVEMPAWVRKELTPYDVD